jgi:hypothetical protein
MVAQLAERTSLQTAPFVEQRDGIRGGGGFGQIVGDEEHGLPERAQLRKELVEPIAELIL